MNAKARGVAVSKSNECLISNNPESRVEMTLMLISGQIALKAANKKYVSANKNNSCFLEAVFATKPDPAPGGWETFVVEDAGDGKIALKACNGKYVGVALNPGQDNQLKAWADKIDAWEKFSICLISPGKIALQAHNGKYVGAKIDKKGELVAWNDKIQGWAEFEWCPMNPNLNPSLLDFYRNTLKMQNEIYKRQDNLTAKLDEIISLLKSNKLEELFQNALSKLNKVRNNE